MKLNRKLLIISLLYFAEGFPFGILEQMMPVYLRLHHMSLEYLGLLSLVTLPYALKVTWAPAVDFLGTRRRWIGSVQFLMAVTLGLFVTVDPSQPSLWLWVCLGGLAMLSATQDIAIDAYSIEMLEPGEMGIANGFRQAFYRVALVAAGGLLIAMGGWIGWRITFLGVAAFLACCGIASAFLPPVEVERPKFSLPALALPIKDFLTRPCVIQVAAFILLYKLGDMSAAPMIRPFWLERGLSTSEIGLITGTVGVLAAIAGGLAGGFFMDRYGIFTGLWFLGLWQAIGNLTYALVAAYPATGHIGVYVASAADSFFGGLGTSAFLAFLMSVCNKQFSATQYAVVSALFRVAGIASGVPSGWATNHVGFAWYFALTVLISLPAFLFLRNARRWIPPGRANATKG